MPGDEQIERANLGGQEGDERERPRAIENLGIARLKPIISNTAGISSGRATMEMMAMGTHPKPAMPNRTGFRSHTAINASSPGAASTAPNARPPIGPSAWY